MRFIYMQIDENGGTDPLSICVSIRVSCIFDDSSILNVQCWNQREYKTHVFGLIYFFSL